MLSVDVLVLTETSQNPGCEYLQDALFDAGYQVIVSLPETREYGTIIASRCHATISDFAGSLDYLPFRAASVFLTDDDIEIVGVYVPSRDAALAKSAERETIKIERKRRFLNGFLEHITAPSTASRRIVCGDFNVIPRNHFPLDASFLEWEYGFLETLADLGFRDSFLLHDPDRQDHSWFGVNGNRLRFDYCYVSENLTSTIERTVFDHGARRGLSDHSALLVKFKSS